MNDTHQHYIWAIVVVIIVGVVAWIYASNRPDVSNYGKDATHNEQTHLNYGLIVLQPGCQNSKAESFMKGSKDIKDKNDLKTGPLVDRVKPK